MFKKLFGNKKKTDSLQQPRSEVQSARKIQDPDLVKMKKSITLPKKFAQQVIELELQVERPDATKMHVQKLMDLYTMAIEYYNCNNDFDNQQYFQSKLSGLLNRNDIKQIVNILPGRMNALNAARLNNDPDAMKKMIAQKREIKKFQDAVKLNIFNQEKQNEQEKEKQVDDQIRNEEEARKVVQREQLKQTEQFRKRLAERNRTQNNRSMQMAPLSGELSITVVNVQKENLKERIRMDNKLETSSLSGIKLGNKLKINRMSSNVVKGSDNISVFSGGKSLMSGGGGMASKISVALSRVIWNKNNGIPNEEEELIDLVNQLEELNNAKDIVIKLNSLQKICKILDTNEDLFFAQDSQGFDIKAMFDNYRRDLQNLSIEKDKAIEEFLDNHTEERLNEQQGIKAKYAKMINMLKNSKDPKKDDKIQNYEEKKATELEELKKEFDDKKKQGVLDIKEKYNAKCAEMRLDTNAIKEALKNDSEANPDGQMIKGTTPQRQEEKFELPQEEQDDHQQAIYNEYGMSSNNRESTGVIGGKKRNE